MTRNSTQRLIALDALRGFTIVGMVIVNDPGTWEHIYSPLRHADWHGATVTDLIFPFFLFIVGVSITLAFSRRLDTGAHTAELIRKIIIRSAKIMLLGWFLWLWTNPSLDIADMRFAGVLQRISLVYLVCALIFLCTNWKHQVLIGSVLLLVYWALLALVPVPIDDLIMVAIQTGEIISRDSPVAIGTLTRVSESAIAANTLPGTNLAAWFDRQWLPGHLRGHSWDPEGILSTIPALVTGIIGMLMGRILLSTEDQYRKLTWLFFTGFMLYVIGEAWSLVMPLNKHLWTSSYTVWSAGLATMALACCILIVDVLGYTRWTRIGQVYGANAITAYVLAGMLAIVSNPDRMAGHSLSGLWMDGMQSIGADPKFASLTYAVAFTLVVYLPVWVMYQKKIFIKV